MPTKKRRKPKFIPGKEPAARKVGFWPGCAFVGIIVSFLGAAAAPVLGSLMPAPSFTQVQMAPSLPALSAEALASAFTLGSPLDFSPLGSANGTSGFELTPGLSPQLAPK